MTLTMSNGPLASGAPDTTNYELVGPKHKILFSPFPRRVRATFAGEIIVDTERGMLLHETAILPVLYVPVEDVAMHLLQPTATSTHCPFKGDASYWSIVVGDRVSEDAVWGYQTPLEAAPWLAGHVAFYWHRVEHWYDEDEEVFGHLRDPYHRVDVRRSARRVRVLVDGVLLADTDQALLLSETGLPNRWYVPRDAVDLTKLQASTTSTHCPYKGQAEYWSTAERPDVAWSYVEPFPECLAVAGHLSFWGDATEVLVD